jgi:hypothetical protein
MNANENHSPWGFGGATVEKTIFICFNMGKKFFNFSSPEPADQF